MTDDGGLEAHVERETAQVLHHQRWFIGRPMGVRLLVASAVALVLTGLAGAMYFALTRFAGESIGSSFWVPLAVVGAIFFVLAIVAAVNPVRFARESARAMGMFPTRAPGYGVWNGRDRTNRKRDSGETSN